MNLSTRIVSDARATTRCRAILAWIAMPLKALRLRRVQRPDQLALASLEDDQGRDTASLAAQDKLFGPRGE
ncbi:hypothetical protein CYK37_30270 [Mesorhizobium loti]|nr:hypothetical protein CYK37_30270 [Mesorhizobium loti]